MAKAELDHRETSTVLAALRHYQAHMDTASQDVRNVASDDGAVEPLSEDEIDELCERINCS